MPVREESTLAERLRLKVSRRLCVLPEDVDVGPAIDIGGIMA